MGIMNKMATANLGDMNYTYYAGYDGCNVKINDANPSATRLQLDGYTVVSDQEFNAYPKRDKVMTVNVYSTFKIRNLSFPKNADGYKQALQGVILTYETIDSVEEKIVSNPTFIFKNATWGNSWTVVKDYLNTLKPGTYSIILRATLTQKNDSFDQGNNRWGLYTSTHVQDKRVNFPTSIQIGDTVERRDTLKVSSTQFSNFYVYGCGRDNLGETGKADVELIIINPYTEEII